MRIFIRIFHFFLFIIPSFLPAQNDSSKNVRSGAASVTRYFTEQQFEYSDSSNSVENSLYDFQKYIPKNILGNTGLPLSDLSYNNFSTLGFQYHKNKYSYYLLNPASLKFFNTRTPYTDLFYVTGTKAEQVFKMTFSYNVKKNWNVSADLYRIRSEGTYIRQNTNDNCLALSTNFKSSNNRYWLLSSVAYNSFKNAENGGIVNDSALSGGNVDKKLIDVSLTAAKKNTTNASVFLKQILNFGKPSPDTSNQSIIPGSRLILTSSVDANYFKYEDQNPTVDYYSNIYFDSVKTNDSSFYSSIENELAWKRLDNQRHRGFKDMIGLGLSVRHQLINVNQYYTDTLLHNIIAGAEVFNTYSTHSFWWNLSAKYVAYGYNTGDYSSSLALKKQLGDSSNVLILRAESRLKSPDFIYSYFLSNNFYWSNKFEKTRKNSAELSFVMKKHKLSVTAAYAAYTNIHYFDNYATARMYKGTVPVFSASLSKDFSLWNWHLNNKVIYQNVPQQTVIRLPEIILEHLLYYENDLLKGALDLQIGASVFYTSAYYANAYMPATGEFFLQNEKKHGNYPFIDFFINAKVKTVRVFFKIDHLNSGLMGTGFVMIPHYPYADRTFRLGASWRFYD